MPMRAHILELESQGRFADAEAAARAWLEQAPDHLEARHLLGLARIRRGDYVGAIEVLQPALRAAPEDAALQISFGRAALLAGDRMRARLAFEQARRADPNRLDAHLGIAACALAAGDLDAAESGFRTALRADENAVEAWLGLGQTLAGKGDAAASTRCFNMALEIKPDDAAAQLSLGQTLRAQGYLDFALRAFGRALEIDPRQGLAQLLRAETLLQRGHAALAEQALSALLEHPRYGAAAQTALGEHLLARDAARARGLFAQALQRDADLERAAIGLADALDAQGQPRAARAQLQAWVGAHPQANGARAALGERLLRAGEPEAVVTLWREALAHEPDHASARADLALALERAGDFEQADDEAELAARGGRWPPLQLLRARAALRAGAYETARDRLQVLDAGKLNALQRRHRQHLLGLAALGRRDWGEAERAFLAMHDDATPAPPELPDTTALAEPLRAAAQQPALPQAVVPAPLLLVGLPGSGVQRLAHLLARQSGIVVRSEGFRGTPLLAAADDASLAQPWGVGELDALAHRYARQLRRAAAAGERVIEWLPHLDARLLPLLRRALPGVRLLLAWREPQACLLDWLAFGYAPGYPVHDLAQARQWLQRAGAHLALAAELLPAQAVEMDALLAGKPQLPAHLQDFIGQPLQLPEAWLREARYLGLPTSVPAPTRQAWLQAHTD